MNKYYIIAISIFLALGLGSCEEEVSGVSLPYDELLVIKCMPTLGDPYIGLDITRTLPPLEDYDRSKAIVNDAVVIINVNGVDYTAGSGTEGYYGVPYNVKVGDILKLTVKWKNKTAYASTFIPEVPKIDSLNYQIEQFEEWGYLQQYVSVYTYLQAKSPDLCYQGINSSYGSYNPSYDYSNVSNYESRNSAGTVRVRSLHYTYWYGNGIIEEIKNNYTFQVEACDKSYYGFAKTYYNGYNGGDVFESNGTNPIWNIKGDGIGLFIGKSRSEKYTLK